jgi:hypothetical protein
LKHDRGPSEKGELNEKGTASSRAEIADQGGLCSLTDGGENIKLDGCLQRRGALVTVQGVEEKGGRGLRLRCRRRQRVRLS